MIQFSMSITLSQYQESSFKGNNGGSSNDSTMVKYIQKSP